MSARAHSEKKFSSKNFWNKVKTSASKIGKDLCTKVVTLYYTARDKDTPAWARIKIYGALTYLVSPVDAIPDTLPGGYVDDAGVLTLAFASVALHVKAEHISKAKKFMRNLFGKG